MGDNAPAEKPTSGAAIMDSIITAAVASAPTDPTKNKNEIPSEQLNQILSSESYMKKLQPLIANAVKEASFNQGLRDTITKLFEDEAKTNTALSEALTELQKGLQSIYLAKSKENRTNPKEGGKRRKSKKRNYYKKRRTSKYR
jgi:hypothetical protein